MSNVRRGIALPILVAGLTIVSACGSSSSSGAKVKAKIGDAVSATTAAAASPTTASGSDAPAGGSAHLTGSFCEKMKEFSELATSFDQETSTDPSTILANFQKEMASTSEALSQLVSSAPDSIKADIQATADAFATLNSEVQDLKSFDPTEMSKITAKLDTPEMTKHSANLDAYAKSKCGIDVDTESSDSAG